MAAPDRVVALSEQLIWVHQSLRERLILLRQEVSEGAGRPAADAGLPEDLLSHCLNFCTAIHAHHTGEDSRLLPALRAVAPDLAPAIGNLIDDHGLVTRILQRIRELLAPAWPLPDQARSSGNSTGSRRFSSRTSATRNVA